MTALRVFLSLLLIQAVNSDGAFAASTCNLAYPAPKNTVTMTSNLIYETTADGQIEKLDLFMPVGVSSPPLIVQIHGGGFISGDKSSFAMQATVLVENGFAVANLNYRLATPTTNAFPAAVQDVRCAVRWLRSQSAVYGYQSAYMGALGYSAGGNLASMLGTVSASNAMLDSPTCTAEQYSPSVQAVASDYGLYDFTITTAPSAYLAGSPIDNPIATLASPALYVTAGSAPFFMARGDDDTTIPEPQQSEMTSLLTAAGVQNQSYELEDLGHGFNPFSTTLAPTATPSTCAMIAFFTTNLP